jgi:hypothetical protein
MNDATRKFWSAAVSERVRPVVWLSRRSAREYGGLCEFVWRKGDAPFGVVDVTEIDFTDRNGTPSPRANISFGRISDEQMIRHGLIDRITSLPVDVRHAHRARWARLRDENAALRVVEAGVLVSAPINYFDKLILSFVGEDWTRGARVVGDVFGQEPTYGAMDDMLLWSRVLALVDDGVLEGQGDLAMMATSSIRRTPTSQP